MILLFIISTFLIQDDSYWKGMELTDEEKYEQALPIFKSYSGTEFKGNSLYMQAFCLSQLLKKDQAKILFEKYLKEYPDGPERLKIGAARWIQVLQQKPKPLTPVQEKMEYAARQLRLGNTGDIVKIQQKEIIDNLNKMIQLSEDEESKSKASKKIEQQGQEPNKPEEGQGSNQGSGSKNPDGKAIKRKFDGSRSDWSKLRDRERDPAFNALKEKFPARYKELIEKYYRSFQNGR